MVAIETVISEPLTNYFSELFAPGAHHPYFDLVTVVVSDTEKPIPKRWVDDVEVALFEGFGVEDGDILGQGMSASWTPEEGRVRLQQALGRLDLSEDFVLHPNLTKLGRHELNAEKRRVKQELKRYDTEFRKQFMRLPNHAEKEPVRPLYVYYRRLKNVIAQFEKSRPGRRSGHIGSDEDGPGFRQSLATIPDNEETPRNEPVHSRNRVADQIAALEARIETLTNEKGVVRAKLQAFQEKFVTENNRKIRLHKDILPIEREYRMYKNLKEEVNKAEAQLRDLLASNNS